MAGPVLTYLLLVSSCLLVLRAFKKVIASQFVRFLFFLCWVIYTAFHFTSEKYYVVSAVTGGAFLFLLVPLSYKYIQNQSNKHEANQKPLQHLRTVIMKFFFNFNHYMQKKIGFSGAAMKPDTRQFHSVVLTRDRMGQIEERVIKHLEEKKPYLQALMTSRGNFDRSIKIELRNSLKNTRFSAAC